MSVCAAAEAAAAQEIVPVRLNLGIDGVFKIVVYSMSRPSTQQLQFLSGLSVVQLTEAGRGAILLSTAPTLLKASTSKDFPMLWTRAEKLAQVLTAVNHEIQTRRIWSTLRKCCNVLTVMVFGLPLRWILTTTSLLQSAGTWIFRARLDILLLH